MSGWGESSRDHHDEHLSEIAASFVLALLAADAEAAEQAVRDALGTTLATAEIDDDVIAPALWMVGRLWEEGQITVADEHVATEITLRALELQRHARIGRALSEGRARITRGHRIVLAAAPGELHVVALRMVEQLLLEAGYEVIMLGADVPADALAAAAARHEPSVVVISTTMPATARELPTTLALVRRRCPMAEYVIGGRGLRGWARSEATITICRSVADAVPAVDAAVLRAGQNATGVA